jgi:hypothetical protein
MKILRLFLGFLLISVIGIYEISTCALDKVASDGKNIN